MNFRSITIILALLALGLGALAFSTKPTPSKEKIVYGISAYQDTILPIVAEKKGWYKDEGLDIQLKVLEWGNVMPAVASGAVDVAIQNFNSFQASAESINEKGGDVIFYYPLYVFKGGAIMVHGDGTLKPLSNFLKQYPNDRQKAVIETVRQLQGKTIFLTKGTEMEQLVLSAIQKSGLAQNAIKIIHAETSDSLAAFLRGDGDAFSGGVTERTEAARHKAIVLIESSDLQPAVIDGLVTTQRFAQKHPEELKKIIQLWIKTIAYMQEDLESRSPLVTNYLAKVGSTKYSTEEYKYTWFNTQIYFASSKQLKKALFDSASNFYWEKSWNANNAFLLKEKKIKKPIPPDLFWGEEIQLP